MALVPDEPLARGGRSRIFPVIHIKSHCLLRMAGLPAPLCFVCFVLLWARCEVGPSIPNSRLQTERGELGADKKLDPFRLLESAGHIQSASSHFHAADFQNRRQSVCSKAHDVNHPPLRVRVKNQLPQMCVFMKTPLSQPFSCESLRDFLRQGSPTDAPIFLLRQRSLLF